MTTQAEVEAVVREFGNRLGLKELAFDEFGLCTLWFDEQLEVDLEYDDEQQALIFETDLGDYPVNRSLEYLQLFLEFNSYWPRLQPSIIAVDPDSRTATLRMMRPSDTLTNDTLDELLEQFVELAEAWRDRLANNNVATEDLTLPSTLSSGSIRV